MHMHYYASCFIYIGYTYYMCSYSTGHGENPMS